MKAGKSTLALPLAAVFVVFFVAPLCVLIILSLHGEAAMRTWTTANYLKFFTDAFNYSILFETLLLGVKATFVCLFFGYPIAWVCARSGARLQSIIVFLVIMPILTSVVVRTFAWIVILGRQGLLNQIWLALGGAEPLRLLYSETGVVMVLAQVQMPLMVLPILTVMSKIDTNLADASQGPRCRRVAHFMARDDPAFAARRHRRHHPYLHRMYHGIRDADFNWWSTPHLHAAAYLSAGDRCQQLAVCCRYFSRLHDRGADHRRHSWRARAAE